MRKKFYNSVTLFLLVTSCFAQQSSPWTKWSWLIGEWKGEGGGQPGQGSGIFSFKPDLNEKVLVRKAHSEYPPTSTKPEIVHDDLLIVYPDFAGNSSKAIYFDNEGHTINYSISTTDKNIVFVSDKIPNVPIFRLTYSLLTAETVNVKFEMSQDGEKFATYVEGRCTKVK